jgi:hypothetical protein
MKSRNNKQHPKNANRGKNRPKRSQNRDFDFSGARGKPTLVLKAHALVSQNISGVNVKQINIAPTASVFGADIVNQFKYFQQYRIPKITIKFENLDPVNYMQGTNVV